MQENIMVKEYTLPKLECEELLGQFLDESHYDTLLNEDCDVYIADPHGAPNGEHNIALKFRKNFFTKAQQEGAYLGLKDAAKATQNRGLAAGPKGLKLQGRDWATMEQLDILDYLTKVTSYPTEEEIQVVRNRANAKKDTRGLVWLSSEKDKHNFPGFEKWLEGVLPLPVPVIREKAAWVRDTFISDTTYANPVDSGIAGWFDRYPRIPYGRPTAYTFYNLEKFKQSYPFLEQLAIGFHSLLPERFAKQMEAIAKLDPSFYVPNTPFTTITVNKNFRTAAHRDAGDLHTGFSNLTVVAKDNDYDGGYLVLPEFRAAVNIRPGDLLLINNHECIHGNTPIVSKQGVDLERISLVCYFREAMLELGTREYEDARFNFVEARRKNRDHSGWREGWNGVSTGMWESEEWFDFLRSNNQQHLVDKYHAKEKSSDLDSLFS
jgi:hypothetical protein